MVAISDVQLIFIWYVVGSIFKILFPYFVKWQESGYVLKFNPAYLMDLVVVVFGAVFVGVFDFSMWVIPTGELYVVCMIAFFTAAGLDEILQRILKIIDAYTKVGKKVRPSLYYP